MKLKNVLLTAAQLSILGATSWVLIATSPPPPKCVAAGPTRYAVESTCGPSGHIEITNDVGCDLTVSGNADVNLPGNGNLSTDGSDHRAGFPLYENSQPLDDGGFEQIYRTAANPDGGAGLQFNNCDSVPSEDGGTNVLKLDCFDSRSGRLPVCTGTLTVGGVLPDGGI